MPPEPLSNFSPGQRVVVHTMPAAPDLTLRLREMGMEEGHSFDVLLKSGGTTGIRLNNEKYILNKTVTDSILVEQYKALSIK